MVVIALGLAAWWQRDKLGGLAKSLKGLGDIAANSFGFEAINHGVVDGVQSSAESLAGDADRCVELEHRLHFDRFDRCTCNSGDGSLRSWMLKHSSSGC